MPVVMVPGKVSRSIMEVAAVMEEKAETASRAAAVDLYMVRKQIL